MMTATATATATTTVQHSMRVKSRSQVTSDIACYFPLYWFSAKCSLSLTPLCCADLLLNILHGCARLLCRYIGCQSVARQRSLFYVVVVNVVSFFSLFSSSFFNSRGFRIIKSIATFFRNWFFIRCSCYYCYCYARMPHTFEIFFENCGGGVTIPFAVLPHTQ